LTYREHGVTPERIIAMIASWCNIHNEKTEMNAQTFCQQFDLRKMSTTDIVFTHEDEAWLVA
jgi:hypothetical protein